MSKIETLIDEIEEYIDNCKPAAFSGNRKITVDKEELDELLSELRQSAPEEIKRYQKIISNQEAILDDATRQAQTMVSEATRQSEIMVSEAEKNSKDMVAQAESKTQELLNEHEIIQQAYARANDIIESANEEGQQIVDKAVSDANNIRMSAIRYTDDMLKSLQNIISHTMDGTRNHFEALSRALESSYEVVTSNRRELSGEDAQEPEDAEGSDQDQ